MVRRRSHREGGPRAVDDPKKISASRGPGQPAQAAAQLSCGDFDFRITRDGTWLYKGSPIGRKPLVKLFSTVLRRDEAGDYWLVTPVERGRIVVEDAPFTAVELSASGGGRAQVLAFRTNLDEWVEAGAEHPIRVVHAPGTGEPSPYILVRDRLEALIARSVYYQLVDLAVERREDRRTALGVWSRGTFFTLGMLD